MSAGPANGTVRVLIVGGSQGSRALNDAMLAAAPHLARHAPTLAITHQSRRARSGAGARGLCRCAACPAAVEPFLHDMHARMAAADLVVSRAGASTLAELTILGTPMVLVPLPTAADDHQRKNAAALAGVGAAEVIEERDLTGERLAQVLVALAGDGERRRRMAAAARAEGRPDAAARVADHIEQLAGNGR